LGGTAPEEINLFRRIQFIAICYNPKVVGQILASLGKLTPLELSWLQYCNFSGKFSDFIGDRLTNLRLIRLSNNLMSGPVPANLATITDLRFLGLDDNILSGDISAFVNMPALRRLYLEDNSFEGQLTDESIDSWPRVMELDLSGNLLDSTLSPNLFGHPQLEILGLHANRSGGTFPRSRTRTSH